MKAYSRSLDFFILFYFILSKEINVPACAAGRDGNGVTSLISITLDWSKEAGRRSLAICSPLKMSLSSHSIIYTGSTAGTEPGLGGKRIRRRPALPAALPLKETRVCLRFCDQSATWDPSNESVALGTHPGGRGHIMGTPGLPGISGITGKPCLALGRAATAASAFGTAPSS